MYTGEAEVSQNDINEVLNIAKDLRIKELAPEIVTEEIVMRSEDQLVEEKEECFDNKSDIKHSLMNADCKSEVKHALSTDVENDINSTMPTDDEIDIKPTLNTDGKIQPESGNQLYKCDQCV